MKKEPILICLYAYYPFENANTNVMLPIIRALSEEYEVHILTENRDNTALHEEITSDGIHIHRYKVHTKFVRGIHILANADCKKKRVWYKTAILRFCRLFSKCFSRFIPHSEYVQMKRLMANYSFVFVMSTCEDFHSHRNMLKLKLEIGFKTPWIAYFMDPHAYYISNRGIADGLLELERQVYERADLVLVTEEIYRENQDNAFTPYLYKTVPYRFGNFRCLDNPLEKDIFIPNKINCVYVGSLLSEQIRSPRYLYQMINQLDERFAFHIVCNQVSDANRRLYEELVQNKGNVHWYHNLPLTVCLGIMSHADILINLGNKSSNQTPSKVFDYIGTGKPIVNLYSLHDDTSKYYLEKYPNKLNIYEDNDSLSENVKMFSQFTHEHIGKTVTREELLDLYSEYNSTEVTKETMKTIRDFVTRRSENGI